MELAKSNNADTWKDGNEEYEYLTLYRAEADFCDEFLLELDIDGDATTIANTEPYWFRAYMNWQYHHRFRRLGVHQPHEDLRAGFRKT